jgi:hypothetical protein
MTRIWPTDADELILTEDYDDALRRIVDGTASGIDDFLTFTFEDDTPLPHPGNRNHSDRAMTGRGLRNPPPADGKRARPRPDAGAVPRLG